MEDGDVDHRRCAVRTRLFAGGSRIRTDGPGDQRSSKASTVAPAIGLARGMVLRGFLPPRSRATSANSLQVLSPSGAASFSVAAIQAHRSALRRSRHAHGNRLTVVVAIFAEEERRAISADIAALAGHPLNGQSFTMLGMRSAPIGRSVYRSGRRFLRTPRGIHHGRMRHVAVARRLAVAADTATLPRQI